MRSTSCATFAVLCTVLAGGPAAGVVVPLGSASGGLAVHYNNNGGGEVPTNVAYVRSQMSATNSNGALF